ncbi:MAG: extracellular solute-binding protein family 1 [Paenibacillaceae bacterium]|jgi:putative aldouronate transport system substrate-binding protein|nr:extracellular solute-binding protein family 1 [Paenibacillaceae bacterium]
MKRASRLLTYVLVSSLLGITATACGSSNDKEEAKEEAKPSASASVSAAPATAANLPALKRLGVWQAEDYNTYPVAKMLEEKTGYKVQYDTLPQDKATDKLNLLIASGESYDVISMYPDMAAYFNYAQSGALIDLTPLIDKYGPNIKQAVSQSSFDAVKVDGKIYAIPNKGGAAIGNGILMRTDWLEKLNLKMPTTTAEFEAVLKAFKEKDPAGNGALNVPMTINSDQEMIENLVGAFGLPNEWNVLDGKLVPRVLDPAYKDYVNYVSGLYKQGFLDKEFVANKSATAMEKFSSGKAGAMVVNWADIPSIKDALAKTANGAAISFIPALKGPSGKSGYGIYAGLGQISIIPKSSKHPEDAIKWVNAMLEPNTFKELSIGVEGKHYTNNNGAMKPILPAFNDERNRANNFMVGGDEKNSSKYFDVRVRKSEVMFEAYDYLNNKQPAELKIMNELSMTPYLPVHSKNNPQLKTMVKEYTTKLIAGVENLSGLEQFQQKYKEAGAEASMKEINDWFTSKGK